MELKAIKLSDQKIALLDSMDIHSVEELLTHYPFRYQENIQKPIDEWQEGERVFTSGVIISSARVLRYAKKRSLTKFKLLIEEEEFDCTIFNRPYSSAFPFEKEIVIQATYVSGNKLTILNYNSRPIAEQMGIQPIYLTKAGISQLDWQKMITKAINALLPSIEEVVPEEYRLKYHLLKKREALYFIHCPKSHEALKQALRALKYEEFLVFQCCMQQRRSNNHQLFKTPKSFSQERVFDLQRTLSFECTSDQLHSVDDILVDLKKEVSMNRLIQGDVGCGKTLVAAFACYATVLSYQQVAFLAPTEILAKQHYQNLVKLFEGFDVRVGLYCASLKVAEKRAVLQALKEHRVDVLVGTHALFQKDVEYAKLGLVVADEQHRFGVDQRRQLLNKGEQVDFLLMSATPIPRTLATALYGDLDISTIYEMPKSRKMIHTLLVQSNSMKSILKEVLAFIEQGNQCYIVCPAIYESEEIELNSVDKIYAGMKKTLTSISIGLLHGQMSADQKDEVMTSFLNKEIQILVTTSVIEVGVDVKDANIMVIYDAHRFGLSQIHQLRGRVGRGNREGYCYLLSTTKDVDSLKRLNTLVECSDGFKIAEADLTLRGPGDILGKRQSGLPGFILGDCFADSQILITAKQDAQAIVADLASYPGLSKICEIYNSSSKYID